MCLYLLRLLWSNISDIAAFCQIVQTVVVVAAAIYAKGQLDELLRARQLAATRELITEIGSEEVRKARGWVLRAASPLDLNRLPEEDFGNVTRVAVAYDRVGYLVKQKLVPDDALFEWQQDEIAQLWERLEPLINQIRTQWNRPNYCKHFKELAKEWLPRRRAQDRQR